MRSAYQKHKLVSRHHLYKDGGKSQNQNMKKRHYYRDHNRQVAHGVAEVKVNVEFDFWGR